MAAKVGAKGGSQRKPSPRENNISRWRRQLPSPPPQGIRLLPHKEFKFDEHQRDYLSNVLEKPRPIADAFLDEVESSLSHYLTFRMRQKHASTPAELYYKMARIRGMACSLIEALVEVNLTPGGYTPDGEALNVILNTVDNDGELRRTSTTRSLDTQLREFVHNIDAALDGKLPELEGRLRRSNSAAWTPENICSTWMLTTMRDYHQRIKTSRGAPKEVGLRQAIRQMALAYEAAFGNLPGHSPGTPFFRFIHRVLNYAQPQSHESTTKHRDLISSVFTEIAEFE